MYRETSNTEILSCDKSKLELLNARKAVLIHRNDIRRNDVFRQKHYTIFWLWIDLGSHLSPQVQVILESSPKTKSIKISFPIWVGHYGLCWL